MPIPLRWDMGTGTLSHVPQSFFEKNSYIMSCSIKWTPCQGHFEKNYYLLSLLPPMLVPKEEWWQRKAHVQNLERVLLSSIIKMNYFRSLAALEFSVFQE